MTQQPFPAPLRKAEVGGIVAASLTPVTNAFRIDVQRLQAHLEWLVARGCSYVSPFGSTGEGPSFSVHEKVEALRVLREHGFDMGRVIPAAMSVALDDTVAMAAAAAELGCRALLMVPPYYYGASADGIAGYFAACATRLGGSFPIDVILYHIPQMSRAPFTAHLIEDLIARHGERIIGVKDSTGVELDTLALVRSFPRLRVFTGDDRVLPALVGEGGAGMIGGMPNVVAADLADRYRSSSGLAEPVAMDRAARRIEIVEATGGVVALKALKARMTNDPSWRRPMPPLLPLDAEKEEKLIAAFTATRFDFAAESD
ncbi:dihydrodipicolinate synthase family protein [Devosia nitrariae]|uniref:DapA-like lyase n=1 Tax=Devosia nitrariae TaxID=2071872 RepID=A0ABQ5W5W0_9HYPH|nr:dihydrodipicolinate synthase family protein [Devosia nitrariae]GLQ55423.1 putative DapA-like lyase [Devosia nitrariae]